MHTMRSVVGWDGSAAADGAVRWAAELESHRHGALHLVRVLRRHGEGDDADRVAAARIALQEATDALGERHPDLAVSAHIVLGDPAEELVRAAGSDSLLVIGASGAGRVRDPDARRIPMAVVARGEGATAVVPEGASAHRSGVVALVHDRAEASGALVFAARVARESREPLTVVRVRDPYEVEPETSAVRVPDPAALERELDGLEVVLDPSWIRSPVSVLTRSDAALLLVLEGHRPTVAPPGFDLERWLAGQARAPFVVVSHAVAPVLLGHLTDPAGQLTAAG